MAPIAPRIEMIQNPFAKASTIASGSTCDQATAASAGSDDAAAMSGR